MDDKNSEIKQEGINPYEMSLDQASELAGRLLDEHPPQSNDRYVCYRFDGSDSYSDIGRAIERSVFEAAFGNDAKEMKQEYGPYENHSKFFITVDAEKRHPSGVVRVIEGTIDQTKTLQDLASIGHVTLEEVATQHHISPEDTVWDVGTLAVLPEYRAREGQVSVQLFRGMYVSARDSGIEHLVSVIDNKAHTKLVKVLGIPFQHLAHKKQPFSYLGSDESRAVYGYVPDFYKRMRRGRHINPAKILARSVLRKLRDGSEDRALMWDD